MPIRVERCGETPEGGEQAVITWRKKEDRETQTERREKTPLG